MPDRALREIAIDAACLLVQEGEAASLSLADVARAIDVDEQRLQAVFASLEDLIVAVADRTYATFLTQVDAEVGQDESEGAYTRAYVRASLQSDEGFEELVAALLASAPYRPYMVAGIRDQEATVRCALEADGIDPVMAHIVRLAADGLWFNRVFGLSPIPRERRAEIAERLEALAVRSRAAAAAD